MSDLFFELKNNKKSKITFIDSNIKFDYNIIKNYNHYIFLNKEKSLAELYLNKIESTDIDDNNHIYKLFNIDLNSCGMIRAEYVNKKYNFYIEEYNDNNIIKIDKILDNNYKGKKYNCILQNSLSKQLESLIQKIDYNEGARLLYIYILRYIYHFYNTLERGGNALIIFFSYSDNISFEIIYLLSCIFEKVTFYNSFYLYCQNFLYDESITKEDILNCINTNKFTITNKMNFTKLTFYITKQINNITDNFNLIREKKYDEYITNKINTIYNSLLYKNSLNN